MTETLKNQLIAAKQKFTEISTDTAEERKDILSKIETLTKFSSRYEDSWTGEWLEYPNSYKKNFNPSNQEDVEIDENFIKQDLEKQTGINLDKLRERIRPLSKAFFDLQNFILTELSFIKDIDVFKNEVDIIKQIEDFQWGMKPGEYIRSRRPRYAFTYDPSVINKGITTPPHIAVGEEIIFTFSLLTSYDNFEKLVNRLIRQLEIKSSTSSEGEAGAIFQQQALQAIIEKFHSVCTQLKNRYNNRPTIIIDDEYDVQDLMNALLRINFEDVRKEEYTPSYAGGSTRIDFLLKREKILIEVKKSRPTLKDKDVGNQLIVDIAHYRSHPDCKHLICFVYDPDNLIVNPRGLEDDLNRNSSEEMIVDVFVRP
jgi:hypothetical protein